MTFFPILICPLGSPSIWSSLASLLRFQFPLLPVTAASVPRDSRLQRSPRLTPTEFRAPPPSETRPYFGAPFLSIPAHQHRGVILKQRVCWGNHGGGASSSPAAALQSGPCLPSPWKPPLRPHGLGGASGWGQQRASSNSAFAESFPMLIRPPAQQGPSVLLEAGRKTSVLNPWAASSSQFQLDAYHLR